MEKKTLLEHLRALRLTLVVCLASFGVGFLSVFFTLSRKLVDIMTQPLINKGIEIIYTGVAETFSVQLKLSLIVGLLLASPVMFAALWWFVRPGLKAHERKLWFRAVIAAFILFITGIFFAYRYVFFLAVNFFVENGVGMAEPYLAIGTYVDFLVGFLIPFGVVFELPVIIVVLTKLGLVTAEDLKKARKFVIFVVFILAAILTPPDVVSQVMLALPMLVLFEVGIICAKLAKPKER